MSTADAEEEFTAAEGNEYRYKRSPDERASEAVVAAVANATDRPIVPGIVDDDSDTYDALPPLYEGIDTDALDAIATPDDGRETDCLVTFSYDGYLVTVQERAVTVSPARDR